MLHVRPRYSVAEARVLLTPKRRWWLPRFLRGAAVSPKKIELLWMPMHLIRFAVVSRKGLGEMSVTVEAWSGAFAIFQMHEMMREGEVEGDRFEPHIGVEEAIETGRQNLLHSILRQRSYGAKPEVGEVRETTLLFYPFFVYYYERRRGFLDIRVLDAVTGMPVGGKIRGGILDAFQSVGGGLSEDVS